MLFLFRGRYQVVAQVLVGAAILVVGIVAHSKLAAVVGGVVLAWGLYKAIRARLSGRSKGSG